MSSRGKVSIRLDPAPPIAPILFDTRNRPLAPESAIEINAKRPPDTTQIPPAQAFRLPSGTAAPGARVTALECLAQAIYYEAASEAEAGQRAVAQVVLNRVRSPVFPNTVCGVVYQGWTRQTGCQFSFTCDGSLQRTPSISGMSRARRIATEALNGSVMRDVGNATHYHANYVVPYWASSLDKVQTVGRHIFYLIRGALGRPAAYNARYAAELEQSPLLVPPAQSIDEEGTPGLVSGPEDPLAAILGGTLAADRAMGTLVTPAGSNILPGDRSSLETNVPTIGASDSGIVRLQADRTGRLEVQASEPSLIADETSGKLVEKDKQP